MRSDAARFSEAEGVVAGLSEHQPVAWKCRWKIEKYHGDDQTVAPFEVVEREGNLLMYGGASCLWECLVGNGTGTASQTLTYFDNSNAHLGVGDSSTAEAATQTDLQAATNKLRKAMDATYPSHTDGTTSGAASITFKSTFATTDANFTWNEWALFNASSSGRMLNRKVSSLGTKTSSASWVFTVTCSLA